MLKADREKPLSEGLLKYPIGGNLRRRWSLRWEGVDDGLMVTYVTGIKDRWKEGRHEGSGLYGIWLMGPSLTWIGTGFMRVANSPTPGE